MSGLANGALVLGLILGPGYLFVRLVARDVPVRTQSELETLVEMLIVGVAVFLVSGAVLLLVNGVMPDLDLIRLVNGKGDQYLSEDPFSALLTFILLLALAYSMTYLAALGFRRRKLQEMSQPGNRMSHGSVLYGLMVGEKGRIVSVSTDFGQVIMGELVGFSRTSKSDRELALGGPHLYVENKDGKGEREYPPGTILIRESQIEYIVLLDNA